MAPLKAEEFAKKLAAAHISPDEPLHAVLLTVYQTALEARAVVGTGARGLSVEGEADLIHRLAENAVSATEQHMERLARRIGWRNSILMALAGLALLGAGFLWGWWNAGTHDNFLSMLARDNDASQVASYCAAHTFSRDGKTACSLPPVWIRGAP